MKSLQDDIDLNLGTIDRLTQEVKTQTEELFKMMNKPKHQFKKGDRVCWFDKTRSPKEWRYGIFDGYYKAGDATDIIEVRTATYSLFGRMQNLPDFTQTEGEVNVRVGKLEVYDPNLQYH